MFKRIYKFLIVSVLFLSLVMSVNAISAKTLTHNVPLTALEFSANGAGIGFTANKDLQVLSLKKVVNSGATRLRVFDINQNLLCSKTYVGDIVNVTSCNLNFKKGESFYVMDDNSGIGYSRYRNPVSLGAGNFFPGINLNITEGSCHTNVNPNCASPFGNGITSWVYEIVSITTIETNPINMIINTPLDLTNYTFDVVSVPIDINTSVNTNCSYTNNYDNNTILFSTTGGKSHQTILTLPPAINQSQTFNVDFTCNNINYTQTKTYTLFKQRIPLKLDIIVPKSNQIFNVDTGQIEFFLQTNYQTDCSYKRDIDVVRTPFTSTGGAVHKTNFTTDLNISTYNMNFLCIGNIINENASKNITFFLDELNKFSLTKTTSQLPQVGDDIGNFMSNTTPGITDFIFNLAIISVLILLLGFILQLIRTKLS